MSGSFARRAKGRLTAEYQQSVFRRTALLLCFLLPAFAANFGVLYVTAALLPRDEFGVFYVAITAGTVLFSGSLILNMFFTRHLASVKQSHGDDAVLDAIPAVEGLVLRWGTAVAVLTFVAMLALARALGVSSKTIIALMILDALTSYVADIARSYLQASRETAILGSYTMVWMFLRFGLCVGGVLLFRTAVGGLTGVVLSAVLVYSGFRLWVRRKRPADTTAVALPSALTLVPAIVGYGLLIVLSNLDVLMGYLRLTPPDLGAYSASSVLPKALLSVTLPLLQVLFPAMIGSGGMSDAQTRTAVRKSTAVLVAVTLGGAAAVAVLSPWLCGGRFGVRQCEPGLMMVLLTDIVPLSLIRIVVLLQFARGRDWVTLWLAIPTMVYAIAVSPMDVTLRGTAIDFSIFAAVSLVFFLAVHFAAQSRRYAVRTGESAL